MTRKITRLKNSFHNTSTHVRLTPEEMEAIEYRAYTGDSQARRRMARVAEKLCAKKSGCTCSNGWGER